MKRPHLSLSTALTGVLLASVMVAGCSNSGGSPKDSAKGTSPGAVETKKPEQKMEMSLFMSNSGLALPDGVDASDNPFINIIEQKANVDLKVEIPPYQDFQTRFNLMLSSGKLPDIVHEAFQTDAAYKAARDGAFIDLKPYYDKSPIIQKYITPQMMELAKDPASGKYWRIPMAWDKAPQGSGVDVRYDLVEKYNGGKWPESVDEWVDLMRKIKKADPSAMIMSNRVVGDYLFAYGGKPIFMWYGAYPYDSRIQGGKIIPNVDLPEYHAAVDLLRKLYAEGLFDKEFATNDATKWGQNWTNKNVLFEYNGADQLAPSAVARKANPDTKDQKLVFAPDLKTYPKELADPKYAKPYQSLPIQDHGMFISSTAKDKDRAWKVIEAFASDELHDAIFWGKEGETYTVKDGKRVPITEKLNDKSRTWSLQLATIFGFVDGQDAKKAVNDQVLGSDYSKQVYDSMKPLSDDAMQNGLGSMIGYSSPDEVKKKNSESMQAINKFTVEAIMGKISMDQFDQEVKNWDQKYRSLIYDPMQKYFDANKDKLRKLGVKMADW